MTVVVIVLVVVGVLCAVGGLLAIVTGVMEVCAWERAGWRLIGVGAALVAAAWLLAPFPDWLVSVVGSVLQ